MAKPDLQKVYVKPDDGVVRRLDGKLGLLGAFDNMVNANSDSNAAAGGVPVGALYRDGTNVRVRRT